MKKSYLMIAAAAALLTACSDTDTFKEAVNSNQKAFTFSAYADKTTKAPNTNSANLQDFYTVFGVYGFKNVTRAGSASDENVFDNVPNEYFASDANGKTVFTTALPSSEWNTPLAPGWYYENIRYWDKMANSYAFFAIAPYEANPSPALTVTATNANIQIGNSSAKYDISGEYNLARTDLTDPADPQTTAPKASLTYSGFKKDYMLADKSTVRTSDVMLNFHHILTKLNVKIVKAASYTGKQELKINELKIDRLAKQGYFTYTTNFTTNGWTTDGTYPIDINADYSLTAETNYSDKYWIETLIFPQTATCKKGGAQPTADALTDRYLYIKYSIGNEVFEAFYDLAYVFDKSLVYTAAEAISYNATLAGAVSTSDTNPTTSANYTEEEAAAFNAALNGAVAENDVKAADSGYTFNPGSQYNLTLTVGPEPIHFDATVTLWNDMTEATQTVN